MSFQMAFESTTPWRVSERSVEYLIRCAGGNHWSGADAHKCASYVTILH